MTTKENPTWRDSLKLALIFFIKKDNPYFDENKGVNMLLELAEVEPAAYFHLFVYYMLRRNFINAFKIFQLFDREIYLMNADGEWNSHYDNLRQAVFSSNLSFLYTKTHSYFYQLCTVMRSKCELCSLHCYHQHDLLPYEAAEVEEKLLQ